MSAFAVDHDWFKERNTKLIGLSIDSVHSHLAWVNNVREKTGVYMDDCIADESVEKVDFYLAKKAI